MFNLFKKKKNDKCEIEKEVLDEVNNENEINFFDNENCVKDIDLFLNKFF